MTDYAPVESWPTAPLDTQTCVVLACLWEATAAKPGNVHRGADFGDVSFADFATSAALVAPHLARAQQSGVGDAVRGAVVAMRKSVDTNTSLGTILLLAPLAAVPQQLPLAGGVGRVLKALNADDTRLVYEAIRLAGAGGLGTAATADVAGAPPPITLVEAMRLAADRDLVARQYTHGFHEVFACAAPWIADGLAERWSLDEAIVHAHLRLLAAFPDSLIARKCGDDVAQRASDHAATVLGAGKPRDGAYRRELAELDFWLRADGHRRNPGTTADLITAGLFVLLREQRIEWPIAFYGPRHD